jgi:muconolactone delta-isomerase
MFPPERQRIPSTKVRTREAKHSRELACEGHLLRLWRPPLQPGEWRTLGLFAAADGDVLEEALASMPLRIWRSDEVTPLSAHPNDPMPAGMTADSFDGSEFLIAMTITVPPGTPAAVADDTMAREALRARELAGQGHLLRLWALPGKPGRRRTLGLCRARDAAEMAAWTWTPRRSGCTPTTRHFSRMNRTLESSIVGRCAMPEIRCDHSPLGVGIGGRVLGVKTEF